MLPTMMAIRDEDDNRFVEDIYIRYGRKLYKIAHNILKNEADAEDCLHDVIKIIVDDPERFRAASGEDNHLISLLVKCTRNIALNQYNREKRRRAAESDLQMDGSDADGEPIAAEPMDSAEPCDEILINEENRKRLSELISELDTIYRDVLYLRYAMWMPNAEIGRLLGISENTVKVRLHRARKILLKTRRDELNELRKKR